MEKFFISRPIFAISLAIVIVLVGLISILNLPIEQYPDITPPVVEVSATYDGADAETVNNAVATPVAQSVMGVSDMLYLQTTSANDGSMVMQVTFDIGSDPDLDAIFTQNNVSSAAAQLPATVTKQGVTTRKTMTGFLLVFSLHSDGRYDDEFLSNYAYINLQNELLKINGVGKVSIMGAGEYAMRIWVKPDLLNYYNVSLDELRAAVLAEGGVWLRPDVLKYYDIPVSAVTAAIENQGGIYPAGQFGAEPAPDGTSYTYTVTMPPQITTAEQFGDIVVVTTSEGEQIRLRDVADVSLGSQSYGVSSLFEGKPTALIVIYQEPGSNAVAVGDKVKAEMARLGERLPDGITTSTVVDTTTSIDAGISDIFTTLIIALVLVICIIYLFIQDWRATVIPLVAIPVSLVGAFALFPLLGFSINIISLLGLVLLALGFFLAAHPQMVFGTKWAPEELALGAKLLRIMTLNAALSFPFSVFESHVNIHERYLFLKAVTMAKSVLSPLISIPLLLLGFRSPAIATLSLVLTIVCGLTYMAYCFAVLKMPVSFRTYDLPLMKSMMGFTFYIFLAVVVDQLNYGIGTLMTTWIHGAELSGVYYSANQLNVYYLSFAMAISNVLIPRVHRMVAEGDSNRELTRLMTKAGRLQFIMLMAVFLGFVAVGRPFVILWAGGKEQFAVDYPVALLLFASTIVSAIQFVGLEILRAKNMHRFRAWVYLAAAAVNVGLMIPLCKYGGLVGVAGSILFITVVGNVLPINWYFRRHVGLDVRWFWVRIARLLPSMLVPAIVAVLIAVLAPVSGYLDILIWGCVFVAVYVASLWLFGMNRYERGIVTGVLDKFRRKRRRRA